MVDKVTNTTSQNKHISHGATNKGDVAHMLRHDTEGAKVLVGLVVLGRGKVKDVHIRVVTRVEHDLQVLIEVDASSDEGLNMASLEEHLSDRITADRVLIAAEGVRHAGRRWDETSGVSWRFRRRSLLMHDNIIIWWWVESRTTGNR